MKPSTSSFQSISNQLITIDHKIQNLLLEFRNYKRAVWTDSRGTYSIKYEKSVSFLKEEVFSELIVDPRVKFATEGIVTIPASNRVTVIGTSKFISKGKRIALDKNFELTTIPSVLSNDSFGTNRIDSENQNESSESNYPNQTIFVEEILKYTPFEKNLLGIGEILGLFSSFNDYFYSRDETRMLPPPGYMNIANKLTNFQYDKNFPEDTFHLLISGLLYKVLLMRVSRDYTVGAGIDHILSRVLEKTFKFDHGKAVFMSLMTAICLFPEWENDIINLDNIIKFGIKTNLIDKQDIKLLIDMNFENWIEQGIKLRPQRMSVLRKIDSARIKCSKKMLGKWQSWVA